MRLGSLRGSTVCGEMHTNLRHSYGRKRGTGARQCLLEGGKGQTYPWAEWPGRGLKTQLRGLPGHTSSCGTQRMPSLKMHHLLLQWPSLSSYPLPQQVRLPALCPSSYRPQLPSPNRHVTISHPLLQPTESSTTAPRQAKRILFLAGAQGRLKTQHKTELSHSSALRVIIQIRPNCW